MILRAMMTVLALLAAASSLRAEPLASADTDYVSTTIYADRAGFAPGETTWLALRQDVAEKWHVFWINPGDAGLPLALDWTAPPGFVVGDIAHPAPRFIPVGPLASYAHEGAPVFLVPVTAPETARPGQIIDMEIAASWQACEEICVPEAAQFSFSLPVLPAASAPPGENGFLFAAARLDQPERRNGDALFRRADDLFELVVDGWDGSAPDDAFFFVAQEGLTTPAGEQRARMEDGALVIAMAPGWTPPPQDGPVEGVLRYTSPDGERAVWISASADASLAAAPDRAPAPSTRAVPVLLLLAFAGGLLLNAMPCVFPILFVKAASLAHGAGQDRATARRHGALYGVGVVTTFVLIGAILISLRAGGEQLGWGFHLQSPIIVGLSAYVLFAVGLNLAGVFTVGESIAGAGGALAGRGGAAGAFFTGVLAVIVAAPCIGPLLTAPMGAALTQSAPVAMAIFVAMALGLAAPFVAIAMAPALARALPRPGAWMATFKQLLAFPVFAGAAYFAWVFARQTDDGALAGLLFGLVLAAFAAWAFQQSKGESVRSVALRALSAAALAAALWPIIAAKPATAATTLTQYGAFAAEPFSQAALDAYSAQQRPAFVIFTAAWCITCQADKLTIFSDDAVAAAARDNDVAILIADWTLRDPAISDVLGALGAPGVPFYAFYDAAGEATAMAPPITKRAILEKFNAAGGAP